MVCLLVTYDNMKVNISFDKLKLLVRPLCGATCIGLKSNITYSKQIHK